MKRKILAGILSVCMMISLFPTAAFAEEVVVDETTPVATEETQAAEQPDDTVVETEESVEETETAEETTEETATEETEETVAENEEVEEEATEEESAENAETEAAENATETADVVEASALATFSLTSEAANEAVTGLTGEGTQTSPYLISSLDELKWFRDDVNGGNNYSGKYVKLTAAIDLADEDWTPIGYMGKTFKGNFNGGNNTISNLKITKTLTNSSANNGIGLFGRTDSPAVITNFTIENVDITGSLYVGAVVGYGYTGKEVSNITVKGNIAIDAWWYAGVIGGNGYMNKVDNCSVNGNSGSYIKGNDGSYIGGIWGFKGEGNSSITNCTVTGLSITGVDRVGGVCGIVHYDNDISANKVNNVSVAATDADATTVGLIAGANQGSETSASTVINNQLTEVSVSVGGNDVTESVGSTGTNISGSAPVSVIGTGVVYDDNGKITAGALETEYLPEDMSGYIAADSAVAQDGTVKAKPEGTLTPVYTRANGFWGEGKSNAAESFVVELYEGETKIASASLNDINNIIDGTSKNVTWSIPFAGSNDGYWTVEWAEGYPKYDMNPTLGKLVVDGVEIAESAVQFNAPDNLNKIVALAEGNTGGVVAYTSLADACGNFNGRKVNVLRDVTEEIAAFKGATLTTNVEGGVTINNTYTDWVYANDFNIGKGVTVESGNFFFETDGINNVEGTLVVEETFYHGYDAKTTVQNGGSIKVEGSTILRYNKEADAGLYIYGDDDDSTVEFDCDYYIGAYSGTFYAEDANIEAGYFLLKNSYDNSSYADIDMTLDNSTLTVTGTTDGQDSFIIDDQASLTLKNGTAIADVRDFNILSGANLTLSVDDTSSISATNVSVAEDVPLAVKKNQNGTIELAKATAEANGTKYATLAEALAATTSGSIELTEDTTLTENITIPAGVTVVVKEGVTLTSEEGVVVTAAGNHAFRLEGGTLSGLTIENTADGANASANTVCMLSASTVTGCDFTGKYADGDSETTRAIEVAPGAAVTITGNTFKNLRQPAYINNGATGTVSGNDVDGTRGFVVCSDSDMTITGNRFGTNAVDICIIKSNTDVNNYAGETLVLSQTNNGASVEDQCAPNGTLKADDGKWVMDENTTIEDLIAAAAASESKTLVLTEDVYLDEMLYIDTDGLTIDGNGYKITASEDYATGIYGLNNLVKVEADNVTIKNVKLEVTEKNKHTLDVANADNLVLEDVILDNEDAGFGGAPLIVNASEVTVKGDLEVVVGEKSWYGVNVDSKGATASLTFEDGATFTMTGKGAPKILIWKEGNGTVVDNSGTFDCTEGSEVRVEHPWGEWQLAASGDTRTCSNCGETETRKHQHAFGGWYTVKEPNCYNAGYEAHVCSVCNEAESRPLAATSHNYDINGVCAICGQTKASASSRTNPNTGVHF